MEKNTVIFFKNYTTYKREMYKFNDMIKINNYIAMDTNEIATNVVIKILSDNEDNNDKISDEEINAWIEQWTDEIYKEIYEKVKRDLSNRGR